MSSTTSIRAAADAIEARLTDGIAALAALTDLEVSSLVQSIAAGRQELDRVAAIVAGEVARRSRTEHGYAGLAQREGFRTPEAMIARLSGTSRAEAVTLVRVGTSVIDNQAADVLRASPDTAHLAADRWDARLSRAVHGGRLTVPAAAAISGGLRDVSDGVTAAALADAADELTADAEVLTLEQLSRRAREVRDRIDAAGVADRELKRLDDQYLHAWQRDDGMVKLAGLLAPENGMYLISVLDQATSPRRGGPRFVEATDGSREKSILEDTRSTERIQADTLVDLVRIGVDADPGTVLGSRNPAVRVLVTAENLGDPNGTGQLEGHSDAISHATIDRHLCETGTVDITMTRDGQPLDVGREQRTFTKRQRIALAVRDGGCMAGDCDRPPSWTEAHHIRHWIRDHGPTNVIDGILVCRHHHLLLHNNGWEIIRHGVTYYLQPPKSIDPDQTLIELRSKSPMMRNRSA